MNVYLEVRSIRTSDSTVFLHEISITVTSMTLVVKCFAVHCSHTSIILYCKKGTFSVLLNSHLFRRYFEYRWYTGGKDFVFVFLPFLLLLCSPSLSPVSSKPIESVLLHCTLMSCGFVQREI